MLSNMPDAIRSRANEARCPFHEDRHASGSIHQGDNGYFRFTCHSDGCRYSDSIIGVIAKVDGIEAGEVLRRLRNDSRKFGGNVKAYSSIEELKSAMPGEVEAVYQYTDPITQKPDMIVFRCRTAEGKTFRQCRPENGGFVMQAPPKPWPIYNRARIRLADTVVIVEGEKAVHCLHEYGIIATTSPGAGKAPYADWTLLSGKNLILWPDQDEAGHNHMRQVEEILQGLTPAPRISILDPAELDLAEKEDVVDYVRVLETVRTERVKIQQALYDALSKAKPRGICTALAEQYEAEINGTRRAVAWPGVLIGGPTKALLPGAITILCGGPGASKSLLLLEAATFWHREGIPIALYELEDSREYHLRRMIAQQSKQQGMTDPDWTAANPEETRHILAEYEPLAESMARCIEVCPETMPTLAQIAEWVRQKAKAGCRIIAIDPVTAAEHTTSKQWEEDNTFLQQVKRAATEYDCSIILVTHPIKDYDCPDMNKLAGSAAFARFAQTILWLEIHDKKVHEVKTACGTIETEHNRTLHILKARNGKGQGMRLAYSLDPQSITFREHGVIVKG